MDFPRTSERLRLLLHLEHEPVAVSFLSEPPAGVERFEGRVPAGCAFWRRAETESFYTESPDHLECPIGTLTMGFEIPPERQDAANKFFAHLCEVEYVSPEEMANLPRVQPGHRVVLYEPLRAARRRPAAVISTGRALQAMMLFETGRRLGMPGSGIGSGRPTCAAIPQAMAGNSISVSFGCAGARTYVGLEPDEMVFALPGQRLQEIVAALEVVAAVNQELGEFHARQRAAFGGLAAAR